jgi:hypothetical protein
MNNVTPLRPKPLRHKYHCAYCGITGSVPEAHRVAFEARWAEMHSECRPRLLVTSLPTPEDQGTHDYNGVTPEITRNKRLRVVQAKSTNMRRFSRALLDLGRIEYPEEIERPKARGDCENGIRPCPYVSCRHNLYLEVGARSGSIKLNFPDLEPHQMTSSCALDEADEGAAPHHIIAGRMNLTRERVRQIEAQAIRKLKNSGVFQCILQQWDRE